MGLSEFRELMLPWKSKAFFRKMRPMSVERSISYVALVGLPALVGWFLATWIIGFQMSMSSGPVSMQFYVRYSLGDSAVMAFAGYVSAVAGPLVLGLTLTLFGKLIAKRRIPAVEGFSIAAYASTPSLLFGFLPGLVGGIGPIINLGITMMPLGVMLMIGLGAYSSVLLFKALGASFEGNWSYFKFFVILLIVSVIFGAVSSMFDAVTSAATGKIVPVEMRVGDLSEGGSIYFDKEGFSPY